LKVEPLAQLVEQLTLNQ